MYKKISIFDFDNTLLFSPLPEFGRMKIKEEKNKNITDFEFWEDKDSLNDEIFDIKLNKNIFDDYIIEKNNKDTLLVLLTSRKDTLKKDIIYLLNKFNIKLDVYLFKKQGKQKSDRINELLNLYNNIEEIEIWDDRDIEIERYNIWKKTLESNNKKIKIKINKV
jgi:acid phosphatase class B